MGDKMSAIIDSACVLANVFFLKGTINSFDLKTLHGVSRKLAYFLQPDNAIVDWTRPNLMVTFSEYRDMFQKRDDRVWRVEGAEELFTKDFIDLEFNSSLEPDVVQKMQRLIVEQLE
jgi:hypothetical protein